MPDPDAALVAAVGRGEEAAVRRFVAAKLPRLIAIGYRLLGDRAQAEEIAQEVFVRAWRAAASWRPGGARFDTWLHTVALNLCRDRLRRRRETAMAVPPDRADPSPLADQAIEADQRERAVAAAIAALPERQREAIVLCYYQALSNIEAADAIGVSVEALESLLARARRGLRETLREPRDD